jgi:hypothetical protein
MPYARLVVDSTKLLRTSKVMETRLLTRPSRNTRFKCQRRAKAGARLEARIARITWGRNIAPYWELLNPYPFGCGLVKMELAAGNVTKATPWTRPAR